jgi:hypothetical protein
VHGHILSTSGDDLNTTTLVCIPYSCPYSIQIRVN